METGILRRQGEGSRLLHASLLPPVNANDAACVLFSHTPRLSFSPDTTTAVGTRSRHQVFVTPLRGSKRTENPPKICNMHDRRGGVCFRLFLFTQLPAPTL